MGEVIGSLKDAGTVKKVLFSAIAQKLSSKGKSQRRAIVVTNSEILRMDPAKNFKMASFGSRGGVRLDDIKAVHLSSDQSATLIVLRMMDDVDIPLYLESDSGTEVEFLGQLSYYMRTNMKKTLKVDVTKDVKFTFKGAERAISVRRVSAIAEPLFKKIGSDFEINIAAV